VGLFGYARELGGVTLPRAISFTCSLYSLGLPPELLAFEALSESDLAFVLDVYPSFRSKIEDALRYTDLDGPLMTDELRRALDASGMTAETDEEHLSLVRKIASQTGGSDSGSMSGLVLQAALRRRFLG